VRRSPVTAFFGGVRHRAASRASKARQSPTIPILPILPLPQGARLQWVSEAFALLDPAHRGAVPAATLVDAYDPATHPDVLMGLRGEDDVRTEFMQSFDGGADVDGHVSKHEFIGYQRSLLLRVPALPCDTSCLASCISSPRHLILNCV